MEEKKVRTQEKPASIREIFCLSGPLHLTAVDWNNFHHRRSVAASLVQGVYILERDRQKNRQGSQAHAPPWWDFFNFQVIRLLVDDVDSSIFGAIYEFKTFAFNYNHTAQNTPNYVIAFRGTINKSDSRSRDLKLDLLCIRNRLHESSRFQRAMQAVQSIIAVAGTSSVWLAGHSLGSAISLLAGKNVTKMGCGVETYLFNPPFLSVPIEGIKNEKLKHGIRFTSSIVKAGLAVALKGHHQSPQQDDPFILLSAWVPYLFVNPADHICSGYIGYFEHRKKMEEIGAGKIERIATQNSIRSLLSGSLKSDSGPLHLLPSAYLTINSSQSPDFKRAHGIHQWWDPSFVGQSELHEYRRNEHHRRSIAASLVQGVYVLERDRQKNRRGPQACAPPWWESFNFQLNHLLIDDVDHSIFGAIYEFFNSSALNSSTPHNAPNYVIAFRGTLNTPATISRDFKLDLLCICNRLHASSRFQIAMKFVENIAATAATADGSNIWLAGHSLGAAIALLAGKNLTKMGCLVQTYLFNPPFLSAPVEILKHQVLKNGIRFTISVVNAALTIAIKGRHPKPEQDDPFTALSSWTPYLFVNPADVVCSEYKGILNTG